MRGKRLAWVALVTAFWAIVSTLLAVYYFVQTRHYEDLLRSYERVTMRVDLCINYGNGTKVWHNGTLVPLGCSLLNATVMVADVEYVFGEYGAFVNSINGVVTNATHCWFWWSWDVARREWALGPVASDAYVLESGEVVQWYYEHSLEWPPKPPD